MPTSITETMPNCAEGPTESSEKKNEEGTNVIYAGSLKTRRRREKTWTWINLVTPFLGKRDARWEMWEDFVSIEKPI